MLHSFTALYIFMEVTLSWRNVRNIDVTMGVIYFCMNNIEHQTTPDEFFANMEMKVMYIPQI